ncbi:hypothetical protein D3C84_1062550 [compost metagenome]
MRQAEQAIDPFVNDVDPAMVVGNFPFEFLLVLLDEYGGRVGLDFRPIDLGDVVTE